MRSVAVGTGLLSAGVLVAALALNNPCHTNTNRLAWVVLSGFLLGFAALTFASGRAMSSRAAIGVGVVATIVGVFGVGLLAAIWWAASGCAN